MDTVVEFMTLFIAAGVGFIIGVVFMVIATWRWANGRRQMIMRFERESEGLRKELGDAIGIHHAYVLKNEHRDVGRSPPTSPMGDVPGAGSSPMGDASVGRKG